MYASIVAIHSLRWCQLLNERLGDAIKYDFNTIICHWCVTLCINGVFSLFLHLEKIEEPRFHGRLALSLSLFWLLNANTLRF